MIVKTGAGVIGAVAPVPLAAGYTTYMGDTYRKFGHNFDWLSGGTDPLLHPHNIIFACAMRFLSEGGVEVERWLYEKEPSWLSGLSGGPIGVEGSSRPRALYSGKFPTASGRDFDEAITRLDAGQYDGSLRYGLVTDRVVGRGVIDLRIDLDYVTERGGSLGIMRVHLPS